MNTIPEDMLIVFDGYKNSFWKARWLNANIVFYGYPNIVWRIKLSDTDKP